MVCDSLASVTPLEVEAAVRTAVAACVDAGDVTVTIPEQVTVERPRQREHGDYATNIAMQIAKQAGRPPRDIAELVAARLRQSPGIAAVEIAGPGFLNITLDDAAAGELAGTIVAAGRDYGRTDVLAKERINLEFVSANPTGPIHLGHSRWAAVGDSLRRLLEASGADVTTEHYINDAGVQMDMFAASLAAAARGEPLPEGGYPGEYIGEIAARIVAQHSELLTQDRAEALATFRVEGRDLMLEEMQASLRHFGVRFDVWFSEQSLHDSGAIEHAVEELRRHGHVYDHEGAVWLRTTDYGDDKDRVLVKSDGSTTYFAADAAYYINKRERGFERCVYMLGADHHGYVGRLKAIAACAGDDPDEHIEVLIGQLVNLVKDGEPVRMSKRAGNLVTLDDLIDAVGVDAARYSLARSSTDSVLTLDVAVITSKTNDNPVFSVQYAHARLASLQRNASELGVERGTGYDPALLTHDQESDLLGALGEFPRVVSSAAELREPHRVARYLEALAGTYHKFYESCRVLPVGDEPATEVNRARLWLCEATQIVLANGLGLLGVSAPERM
jgi:arginyl-tRNA synthetase